MNLAQRYHEIRERVPTFPARETSGAGERLSELALQAKIYAGEFGLSWRAEDGESVEVIHFGSWNREPGPDFCGAKVLIDGVEMTGEIEIDPEVRDWEAHGHALNPGYDSVVLHLFFRRGAKRFFTRTSKNRAVPQVCLAPAPVARPASSLKGGEVLGAGEARVLIEAAAQFRLLRKGERFRRSEQLCGRNEAFFQGLAAGLGYKNNKIPFLLVAQRAGLARAAASDGEARLFGLAGFLKVEDFTRGDDDARNYLRALWEDWWVIRDREARLVLTAEAWKMAALRPANHPHRRMGALAVVAKSFSRIVKARDPGEFCQTLSELEHPYWDGHFSLSCDRLPRPAALIGADRALDLAINTLLPSRPIAEAWSLLAGLTGPSPSVRVRKALAWICGEESADLLRVAAHQQGLLQLHEDFFPRDPAEIWEAFSGSPSESLARLGY